MNRSALDLPKSEPGASPDWLKPASVPPEAGELVEQTYEELYGSIFQKSPSGPPTQWTYSPFFTPSPEDSSGPKFQGPGDSLSADNDLVDSKSVLEEPDSRDRDSATQESPRSASAANWERLDWGEALESLEALEQGEQAELYSQDEPTAFASTSSSLNPHAEEFDPWSTSDPWSSPVPPSGRAESSATGPKGPWPVGGD